jgi:hypothetical protein
MEMEIHIPVILSKKLATIAMLIWNNTDLRHKAVTGLQWHNIIIKEGRA